MRISVKRSTQFIALMCMSLGRASAANAGPRFVVAHWLVPMDYQVGQSGIERAKDDVRAALEEGLDGFAFDAFSGKQAKNVIAAYIAAADSIGAATFKVVLSADMSTGFAASDIVDTMVTYGDNPHYLRIDGKPLLSTYGGGKNGNMWWQMNVIDVLKKSGHPVTFVPYFDRPDPNAEEPNVDNWRKTIQSFPVVDGLFNFVIAGSPPFYTGDPNLGHHWWSSLEGEENLSKALSDQNKVFIAPYLPYYWAVCHPARQYLEYQAGRGMDNMWRSIITRQEPVAVEIVTWNDFTESTFIQPTRIPTTRVKGITPYPHLGYFELLKYYVSWFHAGKPPSISKDALFYFYRPNLRNTTPSSETDAFCSIGRVRTSQLWGNLQNVMYVTTAVTAPATLRVTTGGTTNSYEIPVGIDTTDVPLIPGKPTIELWRNGTKLIGSLGIDVSETAAGDNFNVYGAYAVVGGSDSNTWKPSDAWKTGRISEWFNASN
jgi:hypothetical protein